MTNLKTSGIYGLIDPRDNLIHYVGKTINLQERPASHRYLNKYGRLRNDWIAELRNAELKFTWVVLEQVDYPESSSSRCHWWTGINSTALNDAERWWIAYGKCLGWPLKNMTDGGDGTSNPHPDTRKRMSESRRNSTLVIAATLARTFPCGTRASYARGCRCAACAAEQLLYERRRNGNQPRAIVSHGTTSQYNKGCRCADCVNANKDFRRAYYKQRKLAAGIVTELKPLQGCGTDACYQRGCRCNACSQTHRDKNAKLRDLRDVNGPRALKPCGTRASYDRGCRCESCCQVMYEYRRKSNYIVGRAPLEPCGTLASYIRGCRCEACRAARRHYEQTKRVKARSKI